MVKSPNYNTIQYFITILTQLWIPQIIKNLRKIYKGKFFNSFKLAGGRKQREIRKTDAEYIKVRYECFISFKLDRSEQREYLIKREQSINSYMN